MFLNQRFIVSLLDKLMTITFFYDLMTVFRIIERKLGIYAEDKSCVLCIVGISVIAGVIKQR